MDRNSIIGLSLIFLILVGTIFINQPTVEEAQRLKREQDSLAALVKTTANDSLQKIEAARDARPDSLKVVEDSAMANTRLGMFAPVGIGTGGVATIENDKIRVEVSLKGGAPKKVVLKPYLRAKETEDATTQDSLVLFEGDEHHLNYTFATADGRQVRSEELYFTASQSAVVVTGDSATLTLTASPRQGVSFQQVYTLKKEEFILSYTLVTNGFDQVLSPSNRDIQVDWSLNMPRQERSAEAERDKSSIYFLYTNNDFESITETKYEEAKAEGGDLSWISFKQQFFNSTLIAVGDKHFENAVMETELPDDAKHVKVARAEMFVEMEGKPVEEVPMKFNFSPNHYQILKATGYELQELVPLGWGIFGWVNRFIVIPVFNWLNDYIASFGLIILLLTLIIKAGLLPLVYRSYISTAKMRIIKPEMDEVKAKYPDDPQKVQAENMKLFRKAGVSPLGGCVPMLLQMPILFALFAFFPVSFELRQQGFLWADDLSTYDSIWTFGYVPVIDFIYGQHVSLFTLLMTISTIIYTRLNNQISGLSGAMKYIGYIMPIVFLGFFNKYAAGLSYYYFLSNIITFGQQFVIRRFVDDKKLHAQIQENKKKPVKKSGFAERLEKMAKQQQQARVAAPKKKK